MAAAVLSLAAFQVLAIVGAGTASAVTGCGYDPLNDTVNITIDPGQFAGVAVETTADNLDAEAPAGAILFDNNGLGFEDGANTTQCGDATTSNTVAIVVFGSPGNDELFYVDEQQGGTFPTTIAWHVSLGSNIVPAAPGDTLEIYLNGNQDNAVTFTNTSFDLNGAVGELLGAEYLFVDGDDGDDVIDGSAVTSAITDFFGEDGDDVLSPTVTGAGDFVQGGLGTDTVSYSTATSTQCIVIDNTVILGSGLDANCDGDVADLTDAADSLVDFLEVLQSGAGNDLLVGAGGITETFIPGDGDDVVTGQAGDWIDWSSSSAGMIIDVPNLTATGQGTDEWTGANRFVGSPFDDTAMVNTSAPSAAMAEFFGGAGIDTVDGSGATVPVAINLDILDPSGNDDLENVIGGPLDDVLDGNDLRNVIDGGDGNDFLDGQPGNDVLIGGLGNDSFFGDAGADKVSYATNTVAGVNVDVVLGFGTSSESGDDGFVDPIEIIQGSPFNDSITGGGGLTTTNFLFAGGNGKDTLTGSGSNDTLKGGKGNDRLRGLEGGDTLKGGKGKKDRGWGGPGVDFCTGVEIERGCE